MEMKYRRGQKVKTRPVELIVQNMVNFGDDDVPGVRATLEIPGLKRKWWVVIPISMLEEE